MDGLSDAAVSLEVAAERFRGLGAPDVEANSFAAVEDYRQTRDHVRPLHLLRDNELLPVEGTRLRVVWTPGHSPGHICLYDEDRHLLFSGDHLLPGITPHIARNPFGAADPLAQYLDSLERVELFDGAETLPAHEYRFHGIGTRVAELRLDIAARLAEVADVRAAVPDASEWQIARRLRWSRAWEQFGTEAQRMALVETESFVAHTALR